MRITPPTSFEILDEKYVLFFDDFFFTFLSCAFCCWHISSIVVFSIVREVPNVERKEPKMLLLW